jgi:hypothetical protein
VAAPIGRMTEKYLMAEIERLVRALSGMLSEAASPELTRTKLLVVHKLEDHIVRLGAIIEKERHQGGVESSEPW